MIRKAVLADVPAIVSITRSHFHKLPNRCIAFNEAVFTGYVRRFVSTHSQETIALVSERRGEVVGFILCAAHQQPLTGELLATKCIWCAREDAAGAGIRLHRAAEKWGRLIGADRFMSGAFDPRTEQLLLFDEYLETERVFEKVL
jgi:hypothetical protein